MKYFINTFVENANRNISKKKSAQMEIWLMITLIAQILFYA